MEEKEYLLLKSVRETVKNDASPNGHVDNDDADDESGVFCNSNDFQKTDPTVSLSYWMGQLLTENLVSGRELLLQHLLREAEFEELGRPFQPEKASTPRPDKRRGKHRPQTNKNEKRKRKLDVDLDSYTSSLLEVSRRLDGLLANSRKMNDDLKLVRTDLGEVEASLVRVSADFETTQSLFRDSATTPTPPQKVEECEFVTKILVAAFGSSSDSDQRAASARPESGKPVHRNVPDRAEATGAEIFRSFFDSVFWGRTTSAGAGGEKKFRNDVVAVDVDCGGDFDDSDAVDFMSCANIPNVSSRRASSSNDAKTSYNGAKTFSVDSRPATIDVRTCSINTRASANDVKNEARTSTNDVKTSDLRTFRGERFKSDIKTSSHDDDDDVRSRREKAALMKKILTDARPDPKTTFTALMDFDFFSQIRQPWRKGKELADVNYIV